MGGGGSGGGGASSSASASNSFGNIGGAGDWMPLAVLGLVVVVALFLIKKK